ncbi:MAG: ABC transporter substrate-binding protein, partial [Salinigranum sp.]
MSEHDIDSEPPGRSRRQILAGLAGAGGLGLVPGLSGPPDGAGDVGGQQYAQQGGDTTLVLAERQTPRTVDPAAVDSGTLAEQLGFPENGYETLVYYPPKTSKQLIPYLATKVPSTKNGLITNDNKTLEFPLRQGVTFHTGGEMTAEDVKFSWERAMKMGVSPEIGRLQNTVDSIEAADDYRVRVTLTEPISQVFLNTVVTRPPAGIVSKQAVQEHGGVQSGQRNNWMDNHTAGTGPFKAGELVSGDHFVWERHQDYWGADNERYQSNVDRLRQLATPEIGTVRAMFQRKDIHESFGGADYLSDLKGTPGVEFTFNQGFDPTHITFN